MAWLPFARSLVALALAVVGWANRRADVDSQAADGARRRLQEALDALELAQDRRRAALRDLARDPGGLRADDGHRRPDEPG